MSNSLIDKPKGRAQTLIIDLVPRRMRMHQVSEGELENLSTGGNSLDQLFFGSSLGAAVTLLVTVFTVPITSPYSHATFIMMTWVAWASTVFFGVRVGMDWRKVSLMMKGYREKPIEPPPTQPLTPSI